LQSVWDSRTKVRTSYLPSRNRLCLGAAIALLFGAGCGYHFAASGSGLPSTAQSIYVDRFANRSRFTGLNDEFARYLKDEIANHARLKVVDDPAIADLRLSGEIASDESRPTTFNSVVEPTQYDEQLFVNAVLKDGRTDKTIWRARQIGAGASYAVVPQAVVATSPQFLQQNLRGRDIARLPDAQLAQTQQSAARNIIMSQLAQNLYASMSEGF
jgi:lipopolysaccharide assembly LptE-like protein